MRIKVQQPKWFDEWDRLRGETLSIDDGYGKVEGEVRGVRDGSWLVLRRADGVNVMVSAAAVDLSEVILVREEVPA